MDSCGSYHVAHRARRWLRAVIVDAETHAANQGRVIDVGSEAESVDRPPQLPKAKAAPKASVPKFKPAPKPKGVAKAKSRHIKKPAAAKPKAVSIPVRRGCCPG